MTLLTVDSVDVAYGNVQVLWNASLRVENGETIALLGPNGAGKTTTLRTVCGTLSPLSGTVRFRGEDISNYPPEAVVRRGIAHVPEGRELFAESTVEENVELGAYANRDGVAERRKYVYELFPQLAERRDQPAGTLSGGEQQMVALARGLMSGPDLLLLDEASLGLAPVVTDDLFAAIERVTDEGTTVLLVEQDLYHALRIADRGYVLDGGRIVISGPADQLADDERVRAAYVGGEITNE